VTFDRREYQREYQKAWRARNPEKARQIQHKSRAKRREKINEQQRLRRALSAGRWISKGRVAMWDAQDGKCYLCGEPMDIEHVRIDHDHSCCSPRTSCETCRRGLAHHRCNIAIGMADDDPARLRRMADALETAQIAFEQRKKLASGLLPG
jgi:hypothetical protein